MLDTQVDERGAGAEGRRSVPRWAIGVGALCVMAVAGWFVAAWLIEMVDLAVYRSGGRAIMDATALYDAHPRDSLLPFTYPPFAALCVIPFALLPVPLSQLLLTALSMTAAARAMYLVAHRMARPQLAWPLLCALALASEPLSTALAYGQIGALLLWLVVEDLLGWGERSRAGGVLVGVATGLKVVPGLFGVHLLLVGRTRAAVVAAATFAVTIVIGGLAQPSSTVAYWTELLWRPGRVGDSEYVGNQSLHGLAERLGAATPYLWVVLSVLALVVWFIVVRRYAAQGDSLVAVATTACTALLVSPISWTHHWVWMPVMVAAMWTLAGRGARGARTWTWLAVVVVVTHAVSWSRWWTADEPRIVAPLVFVVDNAYVLLGIAFMAIVVHAVARTNDQRARTMRMAHPAASRGSE